MVVATIYNYAIFVWDDIEISKENFSFVIYGNKVLDCIHSPWYNLVILLLNIMLLSRIFASLNFCYTDE